MFQIGEPELQVNFAQALATMRLSTLQNALHETVSQLDIPGLDKELAAIVPSHSMALLAGLGLRAEMVFAAPAVLTANPRLLSYYRLLYGFSQKEFYKSAVAGRLKSLEADGKLSKANAAVLKDFCVAMAKAGAFLLTGLSAGHVTAELLDDLTLLTLGPQLRGGANVAIGTAAIVAVFGVIKDIVSKSVVTSDTSHIALKNAAGRTVIIEVAPDPDIIIREQLPSGGRRSIVALEVKGGRDFSNVHNRIGEAEKSHQKARGQGYTECWTVVNFDNIDLAMAKKESPSTDRFYRICDLVAATGNDYDDFRDRVISLTGISI